MLLRPARVLVLLPVLRRTHYLHIVDTLETAGAFGLSTRPALTQGEELDSSVDFDPYRAPSMRQLTESWLPLTVAVNSLNRAMGQPDLYPFVLSTPALEKLTFVHALVYTTSRRETVTFQTGATPRRDVLWRVC